MADNQNDISGKVGLDVTDFKAAVADLNRQIRVVESGFKAAAAGMDDWRTTSTGLQSKIESLNKVTDLQRQKISNLADEYLKIVEAKGKDSSAAQNLEIKINRETASLNKNKTEIDNCKTALNNLDSEAEKAGKGVEDLGKKSEDAEKKSSKLGSTFKNLSGSLGSGVANVAKVTAGAMVALGAAAAGAAVGAFKLAQSASDLGEAQNVVEQVFKSSGKSVENWTNTMATSAGLSKTTATQWVGSMGAMMKSSGLSEKSAQSMSESLVQLTGDMSSFYNVSTDEMWEKIRSGISGETEPLKQLGVNMSVANLQAYALSQGISKSYQSMSQAEQTTLRYNYLMSVTKDAQGDFARTLGTSFANQVRVAQMNLQTLGQSIGQLVLPAFMNMTKGVNTAMSQINQAIAGGINSGSLGKVSTILGNLLKQGITSLNNQIPNLIKVIIPVLNQLVTSIVQILPTLLPLLLQGVLQLFNGFIKAVEQNAKQLSSLAVNIITQFVTFLLQAIPKLLPAAVQIITGLAKGLTQSLPKLIPLALKAVMSLANGITSNIGTIIDAGIKLLLALAKGLAQELPTIIQEAPKIINNFADAIYKELPKILAAGVQILIILGEGIIKSIPTLIANLPQIIMAIVNIFTLFNWANLGINLMTKIGEGITSLGPALVSIGKSIATGVGDGIVGIFKNGFEFGKGFITNLGNGFSSLAGYLKSVASSIGEGAISSVKSVFTGAIDIGSNFVKGIWQGILGAKDWIINNISGFAGNMVTAAKKKLGIQSPSRVMRDEVGIYIPQGIAAGITAGQKYVDDATTKMANAITTKFKDKLTTTVDVVNNSAIAVSDALANMVMPERNARADLWTAMAKGTETYETAINKFQHSNDMLGVSTGNAQADLRNMLGEMTNLSTIAVLASNQYQKLGNSIGWTDSKTQEALKTYQDAQKQYLELGQKVVEQQKKISEDATSQVNDLFSKVKDSLKDYYSDMESQAEDKINKLIDANNDWKDNALDNLEKVYDAKKDELDKEETLLDRSNSDEDDADKEAELRHQLSMHLGAEKKKEVTDELNDLIKTRNRRHQKESLDDQKDALDKQYNTDKDNIENTAKQNEDNYKSQLDTVKTFYTEKQKEANLDAEAQELIVSNNQKEIISLLQSYGQDYQVAGSTLGDRLVSGLKNALSVIPDMMNSIKTQLNTLSTDASSASVSVNTNTTNKVEKEVAENSKKSNLESSKEVKIIIPVNIDGKQVSQVIAPYSDKISGSRLALEGRGL